MMNLVASQCAVIEKNTQRMNQRPQRHSDWPVSRPANWVKEVNRVQSAAELEALRRSVQRGQPFGGEAWAKRTAKRLGLESTFRARGRPRKKPESAAEKGS
jgi:putative transposase